jgi:hypothetical protein
LAWIIVDALKLHHIANSYNWRERGTGRKQRFILVENVKLQTPLGQTLTIRKT